MLNSLKFNFQFANGSRLYNGFLWIYILVRQCIFNFKFTDPRPVPLITLRHHCRYEAWTIWHPTLPWNDGFWSTQPEPIWIFGVVAFFEDDTIKKRLPDKVVLVSWRVISINWCDSDLSCHSHYRDECLITYKHQKARLKHHQTHNAYVLNHPRVTW